MKKDTYLFEKAKYIWGSILKMSSYVHKIYKNLKLREIKALIISDILDAVALVYLMSTEQEKNKIVKRCNKLFHMDTTQELIISYLNNIEKNNLYSELFIKTPRIILLINDLIDTKEYIKFDYKKLWLIVWKYVRIICFCLSFESINQYEETHPIKLVLLKFYYECVQNKLNILEDFEEHISYEEREILLYSITIDDIQFEKIINKNDLFIDFFESIEWDKIKKENKTIDPYLYQTIEKILTSYLLDELTKLSKKHRKIKKNNEIETFDYLKYKSNNNYNVLKYQKTYECSIKFNEVEHNLSKVLNDNIDVQKSNIVFMLETLITQLKENEEKCILESMSYEIIDNLYSIYDDRTIIKNIPLMKYTNGIFENFIYDIYEENIDIKDYEVHLNYLIELLLNN